MKRKKLKKKNTIFSNWIFSHGRNYHDIFFKTTCTTLRCYIMRKVNKKIGNTKITHQKVLIHHWELLVTSTLTWRLNSLPFLRKTWVWFFNHSLFFREECSNKGGTNDGSCASGYGVCCTCMFFFNCFTLC